MPIFNEIRARRGYSRVAHHDFLLVLRSAYKGLVNNPQFPRLPVDMDLFKTKTDAYAAAIIATMTRASIAYVQRDSLREELNKMLELLSVYVDHESNNDPAIFATTGLEAQPTSHASQTPIEKPKIPKVDHGPNSGSLRIWMPPSRRTINHFDLQYVAVDENNIPIGEWTVIAVADLKQPATIKRLKPGSVYAFQIRAYGKPGPTDWSDPVYKMCT